MDVLMLSRLQFAAATFFHFLFVPLTLGLSVLIAIMETIYVRSGDEEYKRMVKFWGKLFVINFAIGIVTGITLEFQFGTNWSKYSEYVGDVFGSLLAVEATLAFFLESTFIAVWIFGWKKLSPKMHALSIWLVAIASNLSAWWILAANSFMQHPVGYTIRNGRAELTDFVTLATQKWAALEFVHTVGAAQILGAFFVMGISSWHLARGNSVSLFKKSFSIASIVALIFSLFVALNGDWSGKEVAEVQPTKLAAMESHWETQDRAPMYLLSWPDAKNEGNLFELFPVPGALSFLAFGDFKAEVQGLKDYPKEDRPPVLLTFLSFRLMVMLGGLFILLSGWAWLKRRNPQESRLLLRILPWAIPLPYIAIQAGWIVAEVGRQPWIVWEVMRTSDAVSPIAVSQVMTSFFAFIVIYGLLGIAAFYLLCKYARKGPGPVQTGALPGEEVAHA